MRRLGACRRALGEWVLVAERTAWRCCARWRGCGRSCEFTLCIWITRRAGGRARRMLNLYRSWRGDFGGRPLLGVRRAALRRFLSEIGQGWREDSSNSSAAYLRNRVRALLAKREELIEPLLELSNSCRDWRQWVRGNSPSFGATFACAQLR